MNISVIDSCEKFKILTSVFWFSALSSAIQYNVVFGFSSLNELKAKLYFLTEAGVNTFIWYYGLYSLIGSIPVIEAYVLLPSQLTLAIMAAASKLTFWISNTAGYCLCIII